MKFQLLQNLPLSCCWLRLYNYWKSIILCLRRAGKRWLFVCVLNVSNLTNITLCSLQSKYFWFILDTVHYAFSEKEGQKCSTLNSCFSTDFHRKNREILHKAVLTPQEYDDYFFEKKPRKKCGKNQKTCWGCFLKSRVV